MTSRQQRAAQNREELLEAAVQVFRTHGINAPLQLVIDAANVGRATFYRNFDDRRALVIALMEQALERLAVRAEAFSQYDDGFIRLIENHVYNLPYLTALMEYWRVIDRDDPVIDFGDFLREQLPVMVDIYARRDAILQPLIDQAIRHGVCRPDLTTQDYAMITAILRTSFQGLTDIEQQQLAQRAIELLLNGIRA